MPRRLYTPLVLLAFLLAACGGSPAASPEDTPAAAGGGSTPAAAETTAATAQPLSTAAATAASTMAPMGASAQITAAPAGATASPAAATASPAAGTTGATVAPSASAGFPLTFTDAAGAKVRLERVPQRIVSIFPVNNNTVFAIGAGDQVVAVDEDFTDSPREATVKPGIACNFTTCNVEQIVALKPDLVLTSTGVEQLADKPLRSAGVPVISMPYPSTIEGVYEHITNLGRITGHEAEAGRVAAKLRRELAQVRRRAADAGKVSVYYESDITNPGKPYTVGPGSLLNELITVAGGRNVFAGAKTVAPQVNYEAIVRADPQVVLLGDVEGYVGKGFINATTVKEVKAREGFATIRAVKTGRVVPVNSEVFAVPGPRLGRGVRELAVAIHPEIFGER